MKSTRMALTTTVVCAVLAWSGSLFAATVPERIVIFRNSDGNQGIWAAAMRDANDWQTGLIVDDPTQTQFWGWFGITHGFMADINGDLIDDKVMVQPGLVGGGDFSGHQAIASYSAPNDISGTSFLAPDGDLYPAAGGDFAWLRASTPIFGDVDGDDIDDFGMTTTEEIWLDSDGDPMTNGSPDIMIWGQWQSDGNPGISRPNQDFSNWTGYNPYGDLSLGDTPLFGDFNGDGVDDRVLHRQSTDEVFVDFSNPAGGYGDSVADLTFNFSAFTMPGDKFATSDINGDGLDDVVITRENPNWPVNPVTGVIELYGFYNEEISPGLFTVDDIVDISDEFGQVANDPGWQSPDILLFGQLELTAPVSCDFTGDSTCDGADIDLLMAELAAGTNDPAFDLTGDNVVDIADRDQWLQDAGTTNIGSAYLVADFNLDGNVDGQDFVLWNSNKFTSNTDWTAGNANGDSNVDGQDFVAWNANKFTSSDGFQAVPEPAISGFALVALAGLLRRRG